MSTPHTESIQVGRLAGAAARLLRIRWFVRAPIMLYRARLGFLFGHRLLLLEHKGRLSGHLRTVVLEVVDRPTPDSYIVASGFGGRAQWFRNVQREPQVRVSVSWQRHNPALAHVLDRQEASTALTAYASAHPKAWASLKPVFESTLGASISLSRAEIPLVRLDLLVAAGTRPARIRRHRMAEPEPTRQSRDHLADL